jgi:aspartate oxidase
MLLLPTERVTLWLSGQVRVWLIWSLYSFHPTRLYDPLLQHHLLITEAFRGAGAVLRDHTLRDLMADVHPLGSLAPRDVVSRSMHTCMKESGHDFLWLDFFKSGYGADAK